MKKIFLPLIFASTFVFSAINECKTDVYFGNGILTSPRRAYLNAEKVLKPAIIDKFDIAYYTKYIGKVDYAYNSTNGFLSDNLEAALQKLGWLGLRDLLGDVHGVDLHLQIEKYKNSIDSGHKVLVVAHSQGNLFAREAYSALSSKMQRDFETVSVALSLC